MNKNEISYDVFIENIGERLKNFIMKNGLTQKEFAERIDFGTPALSKVIKGNGGMSSDLIYKLCTVFDIDFNWLIKGEVSAKEIQSMPKAKDPFVLEEKVKLLEEQLALKDKIIKLLEEKLYR